MAKFIKIPGLAFNDVLLVPRRSLLTPAQVDVSTYLTDRIKLSIPIISAAMDTVTESRIAIALARMGGMGIIHRNMPIEKQAAEVAKTKRVGSEMVREPITVGPNETLGEVRAKQDKFGVTGFPVVDENGKLIGMLTRRDISLKPDGKKVKNVMTKENLITAKENVTSEEAWDILEENKIEKLPLVDEDGILKGLITRKDLETGRIFPVQPCLDSEGKLRVGAAIGVGGDYLERARELVSVGCDVLVVDTSHGHSEEVLKKSAQLREKFPNTDLIVGNIVTKEAAGDLCKIGVNAIKVGIGPGFTCTTRTVTGCGVPQLTAILDCAQASRVPVIADGGIRFSGDITKALAAGASCVMLGNLLAGTDEAPGEIIEREGKKYKRFRGMGSKSVMEERKADRYFQEGAIKFVPEGVEKDVPYRGGVAKVIYELIGGLKSGMGLCGAKNIEQLQKNAQFIPITSAGASEGHVEKGRDGKGNNRTSMGR